jgi:hypothetical protein
MAQEFTINSQAIEDKINQLLPSQGGRGAGIDFSASTMVMPIIDLTESAEGSGLREDLQSAISFSSATAFNVNNANTTIINTTGFFRIFGVASCFGAGFIQFNSTDGATTKTLSQYVGIAGITSNTNFDFILFSKAGDSININATSTSVRATGNSRQLADISGNLVNP